MSIAFFNPLFWLGAVAVAVPLWLHLRRRFERNVVRFSALRFLEDQPVARRSPLRLRDLLLLALRMLAVLLLVGAFAWPYNPDLLVEKPAESRVYLLDNTLSRQAGGGWARSRSRLVEEMEKAGPETQIAVIELTARPRVISSFGDDRGSAVQKVRALEASFERGSYAAALRQVDSLMADAVGDRKRVFIYGDNQENQWAEIIGAPPFLRDVEVVLSATDQAAAANVSVAKPRVRRTFTGNKSVVDLAVEVYGQGEVETATVTVRANGREIISRAVELAGQAAPMTFTAQWEAEPGDYLIGEVSISSTRDALAGDNRVFFALAPMREGRVALLADSPFLRTALSPEVMRGYWSMQLLDPADAGKELQGGELADVLCIESKYLRSSDVRNLVLHYLDSGGGVLLVVNHVSPVIRAFLSQLGFETQPAAAVPASASTFRYIFTDHPVFRPFRSPDFGSLTDINVFRYHRLESRQAIPLIFSESGEGLFYQATNTKGRLFVCAFGFDRADTNWPLHPTFIPFLDQCFQSARGDADAATSFEPGDMFAQDVDAGKSVREFVLRDGEREVRRGEVIDGRVEFVVPGKPGCYTLTYDAEVSEAVVLTVNPSPLESDLTYLASPEDVQGGLVRSSSDETQAAAMTTGFELRRFQILGQHIWWLALLAGLGVLLVESVWLAAGKERR